MKLYKAHLLGLSLLALFATLPTAHAMVKTGKDASAEQAAAPKAKTTSSKHRVRTKAEPAASAEAKTTLNIVDADGLLTPEERLALAPLIGRQAGLHTQHAFCEESVKDAEYGAAVREAFSKRLEIAGARPAEGALALIRALLPAFGTINDAVNAGLRTQLMTLLADFKKVASSTLRTEFTKRIEGLEQLEEKAAAAYSPAELEKLRPLLERHAVATVGVQTNAPGAQEKLTAASSAMVDTTLEILKKRTPRTALALTNQSVIPSLGALTSEQRATFTEILTKQQAAAVKAKNSTIAKKLAAALQKVSDSAAGPSGTAPAADAAASADNKTKAKKASGSKSKSTAEKAKTSK